MTKRLDSATFFVKNFFANVKSNFLFITGAQAHLNAEMLRGEISSCPCCGQTVKLYPRSLTPTMMAGLHFIARHGYDGVSNKELNKQRWNRGGDYSKCAYWDMIVPLEETRGWRITQRGHDFLAGDMTIPKYKILFNAEIIGEGGPQITIADVMKGNGFDKEELLNPETITLMGAAA
jgi:hypothetical protein